MTHRCAWTPTSLSPRCWSPPPATTAPWALQVSHPALQYKSDSVCPSTPIPLPFPFTKFYDNIAQFLRGGLSHSKKMLMLKFGQIWASLFLDATPGKDGDWECKDLHPCPGFLSRVPLSGVPLGKNQATLKLGISSHTAYV